MLMAISRNGLVDREKLVEKPDGVSLLDVPFDSLRLPPTPLPDYTLEPTITGVLPEAEATKAMRALAMSCRTFHTMFQLELDKRNPKELLEAVLLRKDTDKIIKAAKTNPKLFFIKATAHDYAMDLDGNRRTIKDWSPYQALFAVGNVDLLRAIKPHIDEYLAKIPNGNQFAIDQENEKFPNGFDFPPSTFATDVSSLIDAITNDFQLRVNGNPNEATVEEIKKFRKRFKPGVVSTGHHFNMNDLIAAHQTYDINWRPWNDRQFAFFGVQVIGFLERLMTTQYLWVACQGIKNLEEGKPLKPDFEIENYVNRSKMVVVPFNSDPSCRLGGTFVIDCCFGLLVGVGRGPELAARRFFWAAMSNKYSRAIKTCAHSDKTSVADLRDCMK
jgi:hypothetical protein